MSSRAQHTASLRNEAFLPSEIEALACEMFERACHDDSFEDLKRRAAFDRQDAGRLKHWIRAASAMLAEEQPHRR